MERPAVTSIIHVALTVTDVDRSVAWYEDVLGLRQVATAPHEGGHGVVLCTPDQAVWLALHHHDANAGEGFTPVRTGLDHLALQVTEHDDLQRWRRWLAARGAEPSEVMDLPDFDVAAVVFHDPDGIPLELIGPRAAAQTSASAGRDPAGR